VRSKELIELFFHFKGKELEEAMNKKSYYLNELIQKNGIEMVPYAKSFLEQLKTLNIPLALATSSRKDKTMMIVKTLQLTNYFHAIITGDDVLHSKPHPDIFIKASEQLHLSPAVCIVMEDAPKGVAAAHSAHMKCVAITATHNAEQLKEADKIINTYKNLHFYELCNSLHS
jgi:HAD superfamily hydrolase (TIGR01509 family)